MKKSLVIMALPFLLFGKGNAMSSGENDSLPPFPYPEMRLGQKPQIGAIGGISVNSSGLNTAFYRPFVEGGHIEADLKQRTLEQMEERNRFGGDRIFSLGGSYLPDSLFGTPNQERTLFVRLIDGRHYHADFTRDLFRSVFMGNADQEERAELAPFRLNSMHYRQFKIGLIDQRGAFELGIAISGFQGRSDLLIQAQEAYIEGNQDPTELRFGLKGELLQQGEQGNGKFWRFAGTGAGLDILSGYDLGHYGRVRLSLRNMGLLHWGPRASIREADTNAAFEGFTLEDPLRSGTNNSKRSIERLEERYLPAERKGGYRRPFPGKLRLTYSKRFPSGVWFRSSILHRPFTSYAPYFGIEVMKAWKDLRAGLSIGHGGFGELAFGLEAAYRFGKKWDLYIRAPHLEGALIPRSMGGLQASMGLHYHY